MKKLLNTTLLAVAFCLCFQAAAFAQDDVKLGVGVAYDGEVEAAGIQVNATFRVSPRLGIAPNVTFYFPEEENEAVFFDSYIAFNLDGHFMLATDPEYHVYAIGGLNVTSLGYSDPDPPVDDNFDESETEIGLNLGLGAEYHLDSFSLFGDLKYVIGGLDRVVLAVGARFPI